MVVKYSIVVPAYKESGNLKPLTERVFAALKAADFADGEVEILIVDDNSRDGSTEVVSQLQSKGYQVSIDVRTTERGLSSAVVHGLRRSAGEYKLVMDADLQHPPESVPALLRALEGNGVQFVIGTRYGAGVVIDKDWPLHRRIISWGARVLARPLTPLSDPMTGFFGIRKATFEAGLPRLNSIGYKIALELFVKADVKTFKEVGFNFATRNFGESKLTGKVIANYLEHLHTLYKYRFGALWYVAIAVLVLIISLVVYGALFTVTGLSKVKKD